MTGPDWASDGRDWPNRAASRFVDAGGLRWHVQVAGQGPVALLVHGTGAATHSWRGLLPLLTPRFTVVAPDLPGHGFTDLPPSHRLSLPGMARALSLLLQALDVRPALAVGHSAGAAILLRMALDGMIAPSLLVSLNGALRPFGGMAAQFFSPVARLLAMNPLVPRLAAWRMTDRSVVRRLIGDTGSTVEPADLDNYARLFATPRHVAGALGMMANWDLEPLERDLPRLPLRLLLVTGDKDGFIPPAVSERVAARVPGAWIVSLPGLGHLAHEEAPAQVAQVIEDAFSSTTTIAT